MSRTALAGLLLVAAGCSDDSVVIPPRNFERAESLAFACYDQIDRIMVPLSACEAADPDDFGDRLTTLALVTQTARGEVAAVDLESEQVLDLDTTVPGFTFLRVGESPSAIVVPAEDPTFAYVASFGSRTVQAVATWRLHPAAGTGALEPLPIALPGGPTDLVLGPPVDGGAPHYLYAAVPEAGVVVEIFIGGRQLVRTRDVPLLTGVEPAVLAGAPSREAEALTCPREYPLVDPVVGAPREPVATGATPSPVALAFDREEGRVLVADTSLPLLHVLPVDGEGMILPDRDAITVGVPTRDVVITPSVPGSLTADGNPPARFIYAIDATDQSILVVDDGPSSPSRGAVLPVAAGADPFDRIEFFAGARSLEVLRPGFAEGAACGSTDFAAEPRQLRGLFVAVALTDGTVRIVDVHDLDAPCRGRDCAQGGTPNELDELVFVRRHRPRIGGFVTEEMAIAGAPTFVINDTPERVLADGTTESGASPGLAPVTCDGSFIRLYPPADEGEEPLVCGIGDAWAATEEEWSATWQGAIPGATGGLGRFDPTDGSFRATGARFCDRGVSGDAEWLVITSDPPAAREGESDPCTIFRPDAIGREPVIGFAIEMAQQDILTLGAATLGTYNLDDARGCFGELMTWEIWSRDSYTVAGGATGYVHDVEGGPDAEDACTRPDPAAPMPGRAVPGVLFDNGVIRFLIPPFGMMQPEAEELTRLSFPVAQVPDPLVIVRPSTGVPVTTLPGALRFNTVDESLYVIDSASSAGLVRVGLAPIEVVGILE
jgi:hypothetical protein